MFARRISPTNLECLSLDGLDSPPYAPLTISLCRSLVSRAFSLIAIRLLRALIKSRRACTQDRGRSCSTSMPTRTDASAYQRQTLPAHQISIIPSAERLVACFARLIAFLLLDRDQTRSQSGGSAFGCMKVGHCQMGMHEKCIS
jgi:hypothetical protein